MLCLNLPVGNLAVWCRTKLRFSVRGFGCALFYFEVKEMNKAFGFVRMVDKLGRIVIPKDLRVRYGMEDYSKIVIIATDEGIIIKP